MTNFDVKLPDLVLTFKLCDDANISDDYSPCTWLAIKNLKI